MIPARIGSQRFKKKNLALIGNKSILEMGIDKAVKSNIFDKIIVNGDNQKFEKTLYFWVNFQLLMTYLHYNTSYSEFFQQLHPS